MILTHIQAKNSAGHALGITDPREFISALQHSGEGDKGIDESSPSLNDSWTLPSLPSLDYTADSEYAVRTLIIPRTRQGLTGLAERR